jgi:hypothetical protein
MVISDVFNAMFSHETTKEARESRIQITDSTSTAVRQMLIYMYTGALPTEYLVETDSSPLLYIANKYQIHALVQLIEQKLVFRFAFSCFEIRLPAETCIPTCAHGSFLRYLGCEFWEKNLYSFDSPIN